MGQLEAIVEDLRSLPAGKLDLAADFIHHLRENGADERSPVVTRPSVALSAEDIAAIENAIIDYETVG